MAETERPLPEPKRLTRDEFAALVAEVKAKYYPDRSHEATRLTDAHRCHVVDCNEGGIDGIYPIEVALGVVFCVNHIDAFSDSGLSDEWYFEHLPDRLLTAQPCPECGRTTIIPADDYLCEDCRNA